MKEKKKIGLEVIFWFLVLDAAIFWLASPANFELAGVFVTAIMGGTSLLFWELTTQTSPDKELIRYIHRITRNLAVCSVLLVIAHHFNLSPMFFGIGFLFAFALAAEYRRFIRVAV